MENKSSEYFDIENEYNRLCTTNELLDQVLALRDEVPKLYFQLLKKEAKVWANKLQHAKISLDEAEKPSEIMLKSSLEQISQTVNEADCKVDNINKKAMENRQICFETELKFKKLGKIKEWLAIRKL